MNNWKEFKNHKVIWILFFAVCNGLSAYSYLSLYFNITTLFFQVILFGICLTLSFFLVGFVSEKYFSWIHQFERKKVIIIFGISLLFSSFVIILTPLPVPRIFWGDPNYSLMITATGIKNESALGSEVWFRIAGDNPACNLIRIRSKNTSSWVEQDGYLHAFKDYPQIVTWNGFLPGAGCKINFLKHPWSGVVQVTYNGKEAIYDLYSPGSGSIEVPLQVRKNFPSITVWVSFVALVIILSGLILAFARWLIFREAVTKPAPFRWTNVIKYAIPFILWWGLYLVVFWPGLMSSDTFDQWEQIHTNNYNNHHPAFHTFTFRVLLHVWHSPAVLPIIQILLLAAMAGYVLAKLEEHGVDRRLLWFTWFIFLISPANSFFIITLWKDILYSILFLAFFICVWNIVVTNDRWILAPKNIFIVTVISLFVVLYRHNGYYMVLGSLGILAIFLPKNRVALFITLIFIVALQSLITGPVYSSLGVKPATMSLYVSVPAHHVAAHLAASTPLTGNEASFLSQIRPIENDWEYDCYSSGPIFWSLNGEKFRTGFLSNRGNLQEFLLLLLKLAKRSPPVEFRHIFCVSNNAWRILQPDINYTSTVPLIMTPDGLSKIEENLFGLSHRVTMPAIERIFVQFFSHSQNIKWNWLFWRPALYSYFFILGVTIHAVRKMNKKFLLLMVPLIVQNSILFLISPGQHLRFYYPALIISILFTPYLLFGGTKSTKESETLLNGMENKSPTLDEN